jgi:CRP/FNR family transcriptional regulator, cyclic AMP receptor protein
MDPRLQARIRPLLKRNGFLGLLPDAAIETLMLRGQPRTYAKGEIVLRRGDPGDTMMMLVTGGIKHTIISPQAKEVILHFAGPGEVFGEITALDGKERAVTAVALEDTEVFIIHTRDLMPALVACPPAMLGIIRFLCQRARMRLALFEDRTLDMRARVARGLMRLAVLVGRRRKDGIHLQLTVSQEDLGNYLGLARANVSRQLGDLKTLRIIKNDGGRIVITDERRLAELGETASAE